MKSIAPNIHRLASGLAGWIGFCLTGSGRIPNHTAGLPRPLASPAVWAVLALAGSALLAPAVPIVQEWYVPQPEAQLHDDYRVLASNTNTICDSVIAITVPVAGTKIVLDHWEDGYEVDLGNPTQATSQIWGDGNNANGKPPGYANDPLAFPVGSVIIMRNNVPLPRNAATILYDGRDRFGSTQGIVMTRAGWFTSPGSVLANSVEVRAVPDWGIHFELPVGEDLIFPTPLTSSMFEHCSAYIMAAANGTVVTIDVNGPAVAGGVTTVTLNQGESYLVNSDLRSAAFIDSTKPIQVIEFFGDIGANYESRGANIPPSDKWSDDYYAPVGTAPDGDDTYIFLHNPDDSATITINYETKVGSGTFDIAAETTYRFLMPQDSAAHFTSVGAKPFWGIGTVGAEPTANNVHDWGYSLVPKSFLSTEIVVGWGAGSSDGTQNGNPVWVTATGNTTIYVDYNGDHLGGLTDPNGNPYDIAYTVVPLTVTRIYEPDKDQTGMRLYTLNGVKMTGAWGQDPAVAGAGLPYLDLGNTLPNFPVPLMTKTSTIVTDLNSNGLPNPGDTVKYTLTLDNRSLFSLSAVPMEDTLPTAYVSYVAGSTLRDGGAVADSGSTAFPLDEGGLVIPLLSANASTVVTFSVTINAGVSGTVVNTARVPGMLGVGAVDTFVVPAGTSATTCTLKLTNSSGTEVNYLAGDGIYVTVSDADANTSAAVAETVIALVENSATGDAELITLTETAGDTGVFRNTAPLPSSTSTGLGPNDGTLNLQAGNTISASHVDPVFGDQCPDTATISAPGLTKQLYLDADGDETGDGDTGDGDTTGDLDRVDPGHVSPVDTTTSHTSALAVGSSGTITAATTTSGSSSSVASGGTLTFSHTPGAGANRLLLVAVGIGSTSVSDVTPGTVTGVTFGGTPMTKVGSTITNATVSTEIYQLVPPGSGAANVVVTIGGTASSVSASATTFTGVHQTTPLGTAASGTGTSAALSATVASAVGEVVFSTLAYDEGTANQSITTSTAGGQVELVKNSGFNFVTTAASTKPGAASVTVSYTGGDSQQWAVLAVPLKPAPVVAGGSVTFTQSLAFAGAFSLTAAPSVTAHFTVVSGSMPASPEVTAVLRQTVGSTTTTIATSSSATASAATGSGVLNFTFPTLGSPVSFAVADVISLVITNSSGASFTIDYDSSTKPSLINLPTNTVIHTDSVTVYDAPYPGGSVVTTPVPVGQPLYVRVVVGDPFGAADITGVPLFIDGTGTAGDISTTLSTAVHSTAVAKTYEYVWMTGAIEGAFLITATANEGYEGTIVSARSTAATLTALDLGTPSITEFTATSNGQGTLTYAGNETVYVRVTDLDQNTNPLVAETITVTVTSSSGDSETIPLTETGANTGIFVGSVPASSSTNSAGTLHAPLGAALVVNYVDPTDPTDTSTDNAAVPNTVAAVSVQKTLLAPADGQIVLNETAQYRLRVTNTGNTTLNTVQVVDTYPSASLEYVTADLAPNSTSAGTLTWTNVGPLTPGQSVDIVVDFIGKAAASPASNSVNVTTGGGPVASSSADVIVTRPAVTVTKTLDASTQGPLTKGSNVIFNISVQNTGTSVITTLPLEDLFSSAIFEFVSATITPDGIGAGSLLWNDLTGSGSLAVNASLNVSVTLKVKGAADPAGNTAAVNYAVDANGDAVPPASQTATLVTTAASISGTVYEDQGASGFGGDVALPAVTVELYRPGFGPDGVASTSDDGDPVGVTTTDAAGHYEFLNLALGSYVVIETDPLGYSSIADTEGSSTDNQIAVSVIAATLYSGNNFLDDIVALVDYGTISGQVRNDADANGLVADTGESGIGGATLQLFTDPNNDGNPADGVLVQTTTSASTGTVGTYIFRYVAPGSYVVVETPAGGWVGTGDGDTTADTGGSPLDATNLAADSRLAVYLGAGETDSGNDFLETNTSLLGKTVDKSVAGVAETLTYTLNPSFPGPGLLTNATVTDTLPAGTTFGSFGQSGGVSNTPPLTWTLGSNTAAVDGSGLTNSNMVSGSYTGDGTDSRNLTGLGFQPALVIIKASTAQNAVARSATFVGDTSKDLNTAAGPAADLIQSLQADGFQVGADARVNSAGVVYHYAAFKAAAGEIATGTYTATGNVLPVTGVGFAPTFMITMGNGARAAGWKTSQMLGSNAGVSYETMSAARRTNAIRTLDADGFTLDNSGSQNTNGEVYNYIAFKAVAGKMQTGTFTGDGTDNRDIAGTGFQPAFAWLRGNATATSEVVFKGSSTGSSTDATQSATNLADFADGIQALQSDGFQVGTSSKVNASGQATYWAAFKGPTSTTTTLAVDQHLVTDPYPASGSAGVNVVVTMTVGSNSALTGVVPPTLALTKTLGTAATATLLSGTPANVDIAAGGTAVFTWTYRLDVDSATANWKENLKFSGTPTHAAATFGAATSPSVILTQPLTFTATVNNPAGAATVTNRASLFNNGSLISLSPGTLTTLLGAIGNRVWADLNGNGLLDTGEPGINDVEVDLYLQGHVPGINPPYAVTTTATVGLDAGVYSFTNVAPGGYFIHLPAAPASALQSSTVTDTADNGEDNDDNGSQSVSGGAVTSPVIVLAAGETDHTLDFGFVPNFSIGNRVFYDLNNDGNRDAGEDGIEGVVVKLFAAVSGNPSGDALQQTTTDHDGNYRFDGLVAGSYVVIVDKTHSSALTGYVSSTGNSDVITLSGDMRDHGKDTPVSVGSVTNGIAAVAVTLGLGSQPLNEIVANEVGAGQNGPNGDATDNLVIDFGFTRTYSIGNRVFADANNNGVFDGGDSGISGVEMKLFAADGSGNPTGTVLASATTDANGYYRFDALVLGTYVVVVDQANSANLANLRSSTGTSTDTGLTGDLKDHGKDTLVTIDTVSNGIASTAVTVGPGLQPVTEALGSGAGANGPTGDTGDNLVLDLGFAPTYSLGNRVFLDNGAGTGGVFNDSIQNGSEPGIASVVVKLFANAGGSPAGTVLATTTTDASGYYRFDGLVAASYVVVVDVSGSGSALAGLASSTGNSTDLTVSGDLTDHGQDTPLDGASVLPGGIASVAVTVGSGAQPLIEATGSGAGTHGPTGDASDNLVLDFGFSPTFSIGNRVFLDHGALTTNDGIQNGSEPGIANVSVQLKNNTGTVVATTTTDASGYYRFDYLLAGTYTVFLPASNFAVSDPLAGMLSSLNTVAGDQGDKGVDNANPSANGIGTASIVIGLSLPSGETDIGSGAGAHGPSGDAYDDLTTDFGMVPGDLTCSIGSLVWHDSNNNGVFDTGESGISGVSVEVWRSDLSGALKEMMVETTTASDGTYFVTGLDPETYRIRIPLANFGSGQPLEVLNTSSTLRANLDYHIDDNNNGLQSSGGQEVLSPVMSLISGGEPVNGTGVTDEFGPGKLLDDLADVNGNMTVDFGFYSPANDQANLCSLGSLVWNDSNNNGVKDDGESGIAGVTLELYRKDGSVLTYWSSTTSASDGTYFFHDLPSGSEWMVLIPASNFTGSGVLKAYPKSGGTPVNSDNQTDSDNNGIQSGGVGSEAWSPVITLTAGSEPTTSETGTGGAQDSSSYVDANGDMTVDFGFTATYSIGNRVFLDNGTGTGGHLNDGIRNGDEPGIAGVVVTLFVASGGAPSGTALATTTTDVNGYYRFDHVVTGTYVVVVDKANSASLTGYASSTGASALTTLSGDLSDHGYDTPLGSVLVGGIASTPVTVGAGLQPTLEATGAGAGANGPDGDASDNLVIDFGFTPTYSIGNQVHRDPDDDGQPDLDGLDGGGIAGVHMALFAASGGSPTGSVLATTTTDSSGYYRFDGLVAGTYVVLVDKAISASLDLYKSVTGWNTDTSSSGDMYDHGIDTPVTVGGITGGIASVAVTVGPGLQPSGESTASGNGANGPNGDASDNLVIDFGFTPLYSIGNRVFADFNNDGIMNEADAGINGVVLKLFAADASGDPSGNALQTTTSNTDGYYRFDGLVVGTYVVVVDKVASSPLAGYVSSTGVSTDMTLSGDKEDHGKDVLVTVGDVVNGIASGPVIMGEPVPPTGETDVALSGAGTHGPNTDDADNLVLDFGFRQLGSVTGSVMADTNNDDIGETAMATVILELRDAVSDALIATTTTNGSGLYTFAAVEPGSYKVVEIQPAGYGSVSDTDAGDPDIIGDVSPVIVIAGATNSGNNFVEEQYGTIAGLVRADTDNNNLGDAPLGGVTVTLWTDPNGDGDPADGLLYGSATSLAGDGAYSITNVLPGTYVLVQSDLPGYASVADGDTSGDTSGSPDDAANASQTDNYLPVNLKTGETDGGNEFVDEQYGSIGDRIWQDYNDNGSQDSGEPGLAGVRVFIDLDADSFPDNDEPWAMTDGNGAYLLTDLAPGTYAVRVDLTTLPAHTDASFELDGVLGGGVSVTLTTAQNRTDVDFGYSCFGTWEEWQFLNPLSGDNDPAGNPDGDRYDNLVEYAFNQLPGSGAGDAWWIEPGPGDTLKSVFIRPQGATTNVTYTLQAATTLGDPTTWVDITIPPENITVVAGGNCTETVTFLNLESLTGGNPFVRIKAVLNLPAATTYTEVEGWKETALASCRTYNNPFLRETAFSGSVSTVDDHTLTFAGNVGLAIGTPNSYYLEVTSGDNKGQRFDVASASGNEVTLANDGNLYSGAPPFSTMTTVPVTLVGDSVVIRPHWTLGQMFPVAGFDAALSQTVADQVQTYASGAWTSYYLYEDGELPYDPQWVEVGAGLTDRGTTVIPPGEGVFVNIRNAATPILAYGEVRENDFVRPLGAGYNLVGGGYPLVQSANGTRGRAMSKVPAGFFGSLNFKTADSFSIWLGDATPNANGYDTYYLLYRPTKEQVWWVQVGDASLTSKDEAGVFTGDGAVFMRVKTALGGYTMPCPWSANPPPPSP